MRAVLIFFDQVINSSIVAGITALSLLGAGEDISVRAVLISFGLTFLIKMKEYRHLNGGKDASIYD